MKKSSQWTTLKTKLSPSVFMQILQKAFDYLNHKLLFQKLETRNIRGQALAQLKSSLSHRKHYVHVRGYLSDVKDLPSGVSQGSILAPFLFNIYINDLVHCLTKQAKFCIHADGTRVFVSARTGDEISAVGNNALAALKSWAKANLLRINTTKISAILHRPKKKFVEIPRNVIMHSLPSEAARSFKTLQSTFFRKYVLGESR